MTADEAQATYWLIERDTPTNWKRVEWWVSGSWEKGRILHEEWTGDAFKAQHFNEWGAKQHAKELQQRGVLGPLRATEHLDHIGPNHD